MATLFNRTISRQASIIYGPKLGMVMNWPDIDSSEIPCVHTYGQMGMDLLDMGGAMDTTSITIQSLESNFTAGRPEIGDSVWIAEGDEVIEFTIEKEPIVQAGTPLLVMTASKPDISNEH